MKLDNWNTNTAKVRAWMSNGLDDEQAKVAIEATLMLGDNADTDDARSTFWTALRSIGSPYEGFPKARVGQPSVLSSTGQVTVATVESQVRSAFASITENTDVLLKVILPHGRTGGEFESWDAFVQHMVDTAHDNMMKAVKEDRWNADEDIMTCTAPLTRAEREALKADDDNNDEGGDTQDE